MANFEQRSRDETLKTVSLREGLNELLDRNESREVLSRAETENFKQILEEIRQSLKAIFTEKAIIAREYGLSFDEYYQQNFYRTYRSFEAQDGVNETVADGVSTAFYESENSYTGNSLSYFEHETSVDDWCGEIEDRLNDDTFTHAEINKLFKMHRVVRGYLSALQERKLQGVIQKRIAAAAFYERERESANEVNHAFEQLEVTRAIERASALIAEMRVVTPDMTLDFEVGTREKTSFYMGRVYTNEINTDIIWKIGGQVVCAKERVNYHNRNENPEYVYQIMGVLCNKEAYDKVLSEGGVTDREL